MMDDEQEALELMNRMKSALPIPTYPSRKCVLMLKEQNLKLKTGQLLDITEVHYSGDAGGITCMLKLPFPTESIYMVSLTHLRLMATHPLAKDIRKYQVQRIRQLAQP